MFDAYRELRERLKTFEEQYESMSKELLRLTQSDVASTLGKTMIDYAARLDTSLAQINKFQFDTSYFDSFSDSLSKAFDFAAKLGEVDYSGLGKLALLMAEIPSIDDTDWDRWLKVFESYQSSTVVKQMEDLIPHLPEIDASCFDAAAGFDFSGIELGEGSITFDGVEYTPEELTRELSSQVDSAKKPDLTLREKFEQLQKKMWLLFMLLNLLMAIPDIPEKVEFYSKVITELRITASQQSRICFTIKERAILREEPNSKARRILTLPYDTPLEIVEIIPRWYQVKYTNETGEETIAWISKISVETEE